MSDFYLKGATFIKKDRLLSIVDIKKYLNIKNIYLGLYPITAPVSYLYNYKTFFGEDFIRLYLQILYKIFKIHDSSSFPGPGAVFAPWSPFFPLFQLDGESGE